MAGPVQVEPGVFLNHDDGENPQFLNPQYGNPPGLGKRTGTGPNIPPGLEYLTHIDQIVCKQKVEMLQVLASVETNNQYTVSNAMGQPIYRVAEDSELCQRLCCGPGRGFTLRVFDQSNQEVMRVNREFKCCAGCCWCAGPDSHCSFEISVEAPPGARPIGYVQQARSGCRIILEVMDSERRRIFKVRGPCCACACNCGDVDFPILDASGRHEVGAITKTWGGACRECCTSADNFSVAWPMDLDVRMKATLMGAMFLIDFMAFEKNQNQDNNN